MTIIDDTPTTLTGEAVLTINEIIAAAEWADLRDRLISARAAAVLTSKSLVLTGTGADLFGFQAKGLTVALELFDSCDEGDFLAFSFKVTREIENANYVAAKRAGVLRALSIMQQQALTRG